MKKYIYINYFRDKNPARREEYLTAIQSNISLDFIDGMIVFLENETHKSDLPDNNKIQYVILDRRMEFHDALEHANTKLEPNSIAIILNLDIFLEISEPWRNIDRDFFQVGYPKKAMVLTRHNVLRKDDGGFYLDIEPVNWRAGDFCDAWLFQTPIDPEFLKEDLHFCVGHAPQCDNLMMGLMVKHYHTYSWGAKYRIYHCEICRGSVTMAVKIDGNKSQADARPSYRQEDHRNIPPQQDWEKLLAAQQAPIYTYTWLDYKRTGVIPTLFSISKIVDAHLKSKTQEFLNEKNNSNHNN